MIPDNSDFVLKYKLKHPSITEVNSFRYYDLPIMGLGREGLPFIEIDKYIDTSEFPSIWNEINNNKHILESYTKGLVVNGIVPKEHNNGFKSIDSILLNPERYLNFDYYDDIKDLQTLSKIKSYFYNHFNIPEAWQGVCHMRNFTNYAAKNLPTTWMPHAEHFPKLVKFVESLPFKSLGYALFFVSNGNEKDAAFIHRDIFHRSHNKSNFINIMFDQKPRPFFIYDAISREKTYVDKKCSMYYFNECDLHGVDAEPSPRYMLRVEGLFEDWFGEKIGLSKHEDYYEAFDWAYDKPQQYKINIWKETDI